jgi:hypothetical protein
MDLTDVLLIGLIGLIVYRIANPPVLQVVSSRLSNNVPVLQTQPVQVPLNPFISNPAVVTPMQPANTSIPLQLAS